MADTLPVSNQPTLPPASVPAAVGAVVPEQPQPPAPLAPAAEGSDLAERSDPLSMEYAGFGARFLAAVLDYFIVGVIRAAMMIPAFILGVAVGGVSGVKEQSAVVAVIVVGLQAISWVLVIGYYIYFIGKYGQTLGKKALKIRVVLIENGEAPGYIKAFLREVVGKLVSTMVFGLGYLWILWDGKKQTWHDKIAGTVVVKA